MKSESKADDMFSMETQADFAKVTYWDHRPETVHGMSYQANASDPRSAVYHHDGLWEIAYRGSVDSKDWLQSDVASQLGQEANDPLFQHDRIQFNELRKAHPDEQFYLTGHSLGGARAYEIARDYDDVGASLFNSEVSGNHVFDWMSSSSKLSNITSYSTKTDVTSTLVRSLGGKHVTIDTDASYLNQDGAHSLKNFIRR